QLRDLFTRPLEDGALGVEFLTGDKVEAAQSVRQHIPEIGFHVVPRLRQSRRNQGSQPMRELVYGVHVNHVVASMRPQVRRRPAPCLSVNAVWGCRDFPTWHSSAIIPDRSFVEVRPMLLDFGVAVITTAIHGLTSHNSRSEGILVYCRAPVTSSS